MKCSLNIFLYATALSPADGVTSLSISVVLNVYAVLSHTAPQIILVFKISYIPSCLLWWSWNQGLYANFLSDTEDVNEI